MEFLILLFFYYFGKFTNSLFYIFDGQNNGPFNPQNFFFIFPKILGPKWRTVPNLLHFGWNLKHKPPQATDSPHPFILF